MSCICTIHIEGYKSVISGLIQTEYYRSDKRVRERVVSAGYTLRIKKVIPGLIQNLLELGICYKLKRTQGIEDIKGLEIEDIKRLKKGDIKGLKIVYITGLEIKDILRLLEDL